MPGPGEGRQLHYPPPCNRLLQIWQLKAVHLLSQFLWVKSHAWAWLSRVLCFKVSFKAEIKVVVWAGVSTEALAGEGFQT